MDNFLLYALSAVLLAAAFGTAASRNPIYGALSLASAMVTLAGIFFLLGAPFLAGVQLIIYAGAVIVLFVMVLMLFDFQIRGGSQKKPGLQNPAKWGLPLFVFGLICGVTALMAFSGPGRPGNLAVFEAKAIALKLFTKYLLIFEILGFVFLLIAVGAVALIRLDRN